MPEYIDHGIIDWYSPGATGTSSLRERTLPLNASFGQPPTPVPTSGVMFADIAVPPVGMGIVSPPANRGPGLPSTMGEWQCSHTATCTRYSPRWTGSRSGVGHGHGS